MHISNLNRDAQKLQEMQTIWKSHLCISTKKCGAQKFIEKFNIIWKSHLGTSTLKSGAQKFVTISSH